MIKLDDFKKLKQLDRIEYLLTLNRIEKINTSYFGFILALIFSLIIGFLILAFIVTSNLVGIDNAIGILTFLILTFKIGLWVVIIGFIIDAIYWIREITWKKKLREEYFKTETKPRK